MYLEMINLLKSDFVHRYKEMEKDSNMMLNIASDFGEGDLIQYAFETIVVFIFSYLAV